MMILLREASLTLEPPYWYCTVLCVLYCTLMCTDCNVSVTMDIVICVVIGIQHVQSVDEHI